MADPYEIAREALELAEKATPGPWRGDRWDGTVKYAVLAAPDPNASFTDETAEQWVEVLTVDHKNGTSGFDGPNASGNEALVLHAGTHYAAVCRALLAQRAVVEAAVQLIAYQDAGSPHYTDWDPEFERLENAVRAYLAAKEQK